MGRLADRRFWAQHELGMAMPDLPAGTVTFLFTDIQGSTALWERDRVAMANAVVRHLTLSRAAIESRDGACCTKPWGMRSTLASPPRIITRLGS
jgi:class 3 adenylate cyclase